MICKKILDILRWSVLMKFKKYLKIYGFSSLTFLIISISGAQVLANSSEETSSDNRIAECPQNRNTLSAPDEFLKMKNPVDPKK